MVLPAPDSGDSDSLYEARRINERCDQFEDEWKRGKRPRIEDYLTDLQGGARIRLLAELLLLDIHFRSRAGESPFQEDYLPRFPEFDAAVLDEFLRKYHQSARANSPECDFTLAQPGGDRLAEHNSQLRGFSNYERLEFIAQGGMGAVYRGRDTDLKREIAVKVLLQNHREADDLTQRFVEEAQIAGQLQHPGIAPIYELGKVPDGRPYFSMKLIKGETLSELLAARRNPQEDRPRFLKIFEQICQTLGYAHSRGVIHRDLKPTNVMVGAFGEVQLMDWGLAKVLTGQAGSLTCVRPDVSVIRTVRSGDTGNTEAAGSHTQSGSILGTLAYMAPEQALGESLDQRADVFGLGAILCEILTGKPPYVAATLDELRRKAVRAELGDALARLDQCDADPELLALARRMLAVEPADRPSDAGQVAQELVAYLESVEARLRQAELAETEARTRAVAERSRRKLTLTFAVALSVVLLSGMLGTLWGLVRAGAASERLRRELYAADLQLADHMFSGTGTAENVAAILERKVPQPNQTDLREFAWRLQWTAIHGNSLVLGGHRPGSQFCAFDSQGNLLTLDGALTFRSWAMPQGEPLSEPEKLWLKPADNCWSISPDARLIALKTDSEVQVREVTFRKPLQTIPDCRDAFKLRFSADGGHLAIAGQDGRLQLFDTGTWEPTATLTASNLPEFRALQRIELAPGGKRVFLLNYPDGGDVTRLEAEVEALEPAGHQSSVYAMAISADGQRRVTGDANGAVYLTDEVTPGMPPVILPGHRAGVTAFKFSSDGIRLAIGFEDGMVTVWDTAERKQLRAYKGHQGPIRGLAFTANGETLASLSDDGNARVWDENSGRASRLVGTHELPVFSLAFSPDGQRLAVGIGRDLATPSGVVKIWEPATGQLVKSFPAGDGRVMALAWSSDGQRLFTGAYDSLLHVWDAETWNEVPVRGLTPHAASHFRQKTLGTLAVSPGTPGKSAIAPGNQPTFVVAGFGHPTRKQNDYDQIAKVWNLTTGAEVTTLERHQNNICCVAFSPDGQLLATASDDRRLILWSTKTWQPVRELTMNEPLKCVTFSPAGTWVVAGDATGGISIWETNGGKLVRQMQGHSDAVYRLAFAPDGKTLATASWDSTIKLWDPLCGREMRTLRDHQEWVSCLAFSPDGNTLATGSFDRTVRLWAAKSLSEIDSFQPGSTVGSGD